MGRSIKLNDNQYWDSSAIVTNDKGASLENLFYKSSGSYEAGDIVIYNTGISGSEHYKLFVCIQNSTGNVPTNQSYWAPVFNVV